MTRETKIGLVVACSFLCLVGIVVASKWKRGDDPSEEQTVVVAANKPTQNGGSPEKKVEPTKKPESASSDKKGDNSGPVFPPLPPVNVITPPKNDPMIPKLQEAVKSANLNPSGPGPVPIPAPVEVNIGPMPLLQTDGKKLSPFEGSKPIAVEPVNPPVAVVPPVGSFPAPKPLDVPLNKKDGVTIPLIEAPKPGAGPVEVVPSIEGFGKPPVLPPLGKEPVVVKPPEMPTFPPLGKEPITVKPPEVGTFPPLGKEPITVKPPELQPFVPKDPAPMGPIPSIPPLTPLNKEPASVTPIPPISVGVKPTPVVKESNLGIYEVRPGETTFPILSTRLYGTDKYADALLAYNRTHGNAAGIKNVAYLNFNPPVVQAGQQILQPSKEILEREYGASIEPARSTPAVKINTPSPLNPPSGSVPTIPSVPTAAAGRNYVVQNPSGESILDIAERQLGNRGRWADIYKLNQSNPTVQPQFRIPAGTELKMPAN